MKTESNLLQLKIDEIKELKKENFNLKDELKCQNKIVYSLKRMNGLKTLTKEKLDDEIRFKLGGDWKIKRLGFVFSYYNKHHVIFKQLFVEFLSFVE